MPPLALRLSFAFFFVYLSVVAGAMLWPRVFDGVMGLVGLSWPASPFRELHLLANMSLCGLVPTAFMAVRTAPRRNVVVRPAGFAEAVLHRNGTPGGCGPAAASRVDAQGCWGRTSARQAHSASALALRAGFFRRGRTEPSSRGLRECTASQPPVTSTTSRGI